MQYKDEIRFEFLVSEKWKMLFSNSFEKRFTLIFLGEVKIRIKIAAKHSRWQHLKLVLKKLKEIFFKKNGTFFKM